MNFPMGSKESNFWLLSSSPVSHGCNECTLVDFEAVGLTPGGSIGLVPGAAQIGQRINVQGVSDSSVPLFGMSNSEFGGA